LWVEPRALGDSPGDDRGRGGSKGKQKEKFDELIAAHLRQAFRAGQKIEPVCHGVADEKISDRRYREIAHDFDERIHLVFLAHGADLEKGKPGMHCQHHNCAKQNE
jgi:hypothetical protein